MAKQRPVSRIQAKALLAAEQNRLTDQRYKGCAIRVQEGVWKRLKVIAMEQSIPIAELVREALDYYIEEIDKVKAELRSSK